MLCKWNRQSARKLEAHFKSGAISPHCSSRTFPRAYSTSRAAAQIYSPLSLFISTAPLRPCITFNRSRLPQEKLAINHAFLAQQQGSSSPLRGPDPLPRLKSTQTKLMQSPRWQKTNVDLPWIAVVHSVISFVTHSAPLALQPGPRLLFQLTFSPTVLPISSENVFETGRFCSRWIWKRDWD